MKQKQCKAEGCEVLFTPRNMQHKTCGYECAKAYAKAVMTKRREKQARLDLKAFNQQDKAWVLKQAQKAVNRYILLRDKGRPCISCGVKANRYEAGHYMSAGGNANVRFDEANIHAQCHKCNCHLSGNLLKYRDNLEDKIGSDEVERLEKREPKHWSIDELNEIIDTYKQKIKDMI